MSAFGGGYPDHNSPKMGGNLPQSYHVVNEGFEEAKFSAEVDHEPGPQPRQGLVERIKIALLRLARR